MDYLYKSILNIKELERNTKRLGGNKYLPEFIESIKDH